MAKLNKSNPLLRSLKPVFKKMSQVSLLKNNRPSLATIKQRESLIVHELTILYQSQYKLKNVNNIKPKHFEYLLAIWYASDIKLKTLNAKISWFGLLFKIIGKAGMEQIVLNDNPIPDKFLKQLPPAAYELISETEAKQRINNMRHESLICALHAELMLLFNLTKKESLLLNPVLSNRGTFLITRNGVSKGRDKVIKIDTDQQRQLLKTACAYVENKSTIIKPKKISLKKYSDHFDYICKKHGISPQHLTRIQVK